MNQSLLPTGFYDQLPPVADYRASAIHRLLGIFASFGYLHICPPLAEFEFNLLPKEHPSVSAQAFRVLDPDSKQMLAIRTDMTLQAARIAATSMAHHSRPLRLSYAGDILWAEADKLSPIRQHTQLGIEHIGNETLDADIEVIRILVIALGKVGVSDITLDLHIPPLIDILLAEEKTIDRNEIIDALNHKDKVQLQQIGAENTSLLLTLMDLDPDPQKSITRLQALTLPKSIAAHITDLTTLIKHLHTHLPDLAITLDALEPSGFHYHTGLSFSLFANQNATEIIRGGRYSLPHSNETAVGASLYLTGLLPLLPNAPSIPTILIPLALPESEIEALHTKGYYTCFAMTNNIIEESQKLGFAGYLQNGEIILNSDA